MAQTISDLPQATSSSRFPDVRVTHGLVVRMRDGTELCLDLLGPDADGPFPVVLIRTPYDKVVQRELPPGTAQGLPYDHDFVHSLVRRGYILAIQDVRGRFNSNGEWHPYVYEQEDGYDTIEWIVRQPWCDGNIGMVGRSYVGFTQWAAAATQPRGLKAIVPIGAQPDLFVAGFPIFNGAFNLPMGELLVTMGRRSFQIRDFMNSVLKTTHDYFETLPLAEMPTAIGTPAPSWWMEMVSHPNRDEYWRRGSYAEALDRVSVPALNVSGWYDLTFHGALHNYREVRRRGATEEAREGQRLVMGPWGHWANASAAVGPIDFGPGAVTGLTGYVIRFLDRWLKGDANGVDDDPRVHLFIMGANEWWAAEDWPLPETRYVRLFLHSGGSANGADGDGRLSSETPASEPADSYRYDPLDPVRASWSMHEGPVDDRGISDRRDVLCFTSDPLEEPIDVVGPLSCTLHASSSARDTDWHLRLVDVHPDGYAQFLTHGALRARFRNSFERPTLLTPGKSETFEIELGATANRFMPGHRIRLEITSSWFPRYDRNLNSGADNPFLDSDSVVAEQTVYHDSGRRSSILLPIVG
ncbi:MAG: CocE/NonD family hydrolase [Gaiellaceae bacterium]